MNLQVVSPETVGFSPTRLARISTVMQRYVDQGKIAGISTMIARKGQIAHFEQVGRMDKEGDKPMSADAIFRIYSMTKPIISTALMTLYEQGLFQLIDPVAKYIPAFAQVKVLEAAADGSTQEVAPRQPMLVGQLLTHTSGLTYHFLEDSPVSALYQQGNLGRDPNQTLADMMQELAQLPLAFHPGTRWHYSLGIDVAAYLIEVLSGKPLATYLQETIFDPLGMVDTGFFVPEENHDRLVTMYGLPDVSGRDISLSKLFMAWQSGYNERIDSVAESYPAVKTENFARGGYGLFSTAQDYLRFAQMLLNQGKLNDTRILSRKTAELMHSNHLPPNLLPYTLGGIPALGYGYGLGSRVLMNVAASQVPGSVGEFGWGGAATTYYWVDPQEEIIGIFMAQYMMGFELAQKDFQVLTYAALVD